MKSTQKQHIHHIIFICLLMVVGWGVNTINGKTNFTSNVTTINENKSLLLPNNNRDLIWTTGDVNISYYNNDTLTFEFDYELEYDNIFFEIRTGLWNGNMEGHYFDFFLNDIYVGQFDGGSSYISDPTITFINIDEYIQLGTNQIVLIFYVDYEGRLGYISVNGDPTEQCPDNIDGDFNYDGSVNVIDIIILVDLILTLQYDICNDINLDESINVMDIMVIINIILNE